MSAFTFSSMKDVHDAIAMGLGDFKYHRRRKLLRSVCLYAVIAGRPLEALPASRHALTARYGRQREGEFRDLFFRGSTKALRHWRSDVSVAIDVATGERSAREERRHRLDEWTPLLLMIAETAGEDPEKRRLAILGLSALADFARRDRLTPQKVTHAWIDAKLAAAPDGAKRRLLRSGVAAMIATGRLAPRAVPSRSASPLPPRFDAAFTAFISAKLEGELVSEYCDVRHSGVTDNTVRSYSSAVKFQVRALRAAGVLRDGEDPPPETFAREDWVWAALNGQVNRLQAIQPLSRKSMLAYIDNLIRVLRSFNPALESQRAKLFYVIKKKFSDGPYLKKKRRVVDRARDDVAFRASLAQLPFALRQRAETLLARGAKHALTWHESREAMICGGAAAILKILLHAPLRISECLALSRWGEQPSLIIPFEPGVVRIDLPGTLTKNGKPFCAEIDEIDGDGLRTMLLWFEAHIRPLVLQYTWSYKALEGSERFLPITSRRAYAWVVKSTARRDIEMNPHLLRNVMVNLVLLSGDMTIAEAAALINVEERTARAHYEEPDTAKRARSARRAASGLLASARGDVPS
jgi:hypothetical protein